MKAWRVLAFVAAALMLGVALLALQVKVTSAIPFFAIAAAAIVVGLLPLDRRDRVHCRQCGADVEVQAGGTGACPRCGQPWQSPHL